MMRFEKRVYDLSTVRFGKAIKQTNKQTMNKQTKITDYYKIERVWYSQRPRLYRQDCQVDQTEIYEPMAPRIKRRRTAKTKAAVWEWAQIWESLKDME